MKNLLKWFTDKAQALRSAKQAGVARQISEWKAARRPKKAKSTKVRYKPGSGSLSAVSAAIQKDYGAILSRRDRRRLAKLDEVPFKPYYNI